MDIKIIGKVTKRSAVLDGRKLPKLRLHTRTIVRDGRYVFVGSQSLREVELDERREVGLIFGDAKVANSLIETFQHDWRLIELESRMNGKDKEDKTQVDRVAKKVAKAVAKELPSVASALEVTVKEVAAKTRVELDAAHVDESMKKAVKSTVHDVVRDIFEEEVRPK